MCEFHQLKSVKIRAITSTSTAQHTSLVIASYN